MPTLGEWTNALTIPRRITVDSTNDIAERVNAKPSSQSFAGVPKTAISVDEFSPPRTIEITTAELLHSIGKVITPRIENLADLCSTWARIRYIWAFSPDAHPSSLRLSPEAMDIDFHQKGLLSDEVGVGMAAHIVERYFGGKNPIDVYLALQNQNIPGLHKRYSTSPDYLFDQGNGNYIILECKGTRSDGSYFLKQLKRGTEQVPSLEFTAGQTPLYLVISTKMSENNTDVYIIDPPSEKKESRKFKIKDSQKFQNDVRDIQFSNLYLYAGVTAKAADLSPVPQKKLRLNRLPKIDSPPHERRIPSIQEDFVGSEQEINIIGEANSIKIFQGILREAYEIIEERDIDSFLDTGKRLYNKVREVSKEGRQTISEIENADQSVVILDHTNNTRIVNVFGHDNTILQFEISR